MLYFRVLQQGLSDLPSADSSIRKKITEQAHEMGWPAMHDMLKKIDPKASSRIHQQYVTERSTTSYVLLPRHQYRQFEPNFSHLY